MRIYPICIAPFPLNPFFSMVLVRLYGNSWKWQLLRRCFAEWIIRMDQFGEMSKTKQVAYAETSERGAAGKRTVSRRRGAGVSLLTDCSLGFPHVLSPHRTRFWGSHEFVLCSRGSQHSRVC